MRCNEVRKFLSPYLDSELDPTMTFKVSQHLEQCTRCATRFDREGHAESLIAERLKQMEPVVQWATLENVVLSAPRPIYRRPVWWVAAAAAVAFVLIGFGSWPSASMADSVQWAADELERLSPAGGAFRENQSCSASNYKNMCYEVLSQDVDLNLEGLRPHDVKLVAASSKLFQQGGGGVQLLMNCCNQPILVTMGLADTPGEFQGVARSFDEDGIATVTCKGKSYHVAVRRVGQMILVGVASTRHQVDHVINGIACRPI